MDTFFRCSMTLIIILKLFHQIEYVYIYIFDTNNIIRHGKKYWREYRMRMLRRNLNTF